MKSYYESLIKKNLLTKDGYRGQITRKGRNLNRLIDAFVQERERKDEQTFFLDVATVWVEGRTKIPHAISLASFVIFLLQYVSIFVVGNVSGILAIIYLIGFLCLPIIGIFSAILGFGWRKILLLVGNIVNLFVIFMVFYKL
ncbi:hypothetical protein MKX54_05475 [Alkalihalobacillus sp. FSL R5-0424]